MIRNGKTQKLLVDGEDKSGYYLLCDEGDEVFMPGALTALDLKLGQMVNAFVFIDSASNQIATTDFPFAEAGDLACLRVTHKSKSGAFLDIGLPKDLLVPCKLQKYEMHIDGHHLVKVLLDDQGRMFGTEKIGPYLESPDFLERLQIVKVLPYHRTPLGFKVLIEGRCGGMIFHNEIFTQIDLGQTYEASVKTIRSDGQVDLVLGKVGAAAAASNSETLLEAIKQNGGRLELTDKSPPDEINRILGMSKKSFKNAVGALYKQRLICLEDTYIALTQ